MRKTKSRTLGSLVFLATILACTFTAASAQTSRGDNAKFPLANTKWELVELDSKPVQDGYYLSFKQAKQLNGGATGSLVASDRCNDYTGDYEVSDHSLHVHLGLSTLVACPVRDNKDVDSFIPTLGQTSAFKIHRAILELLNRDGAVVARLAPDQD
jgi:heat shock protein HslJ